MLDKIIKCPCCGEPYMTYSLYAGDQSACPECREKVRLRMEKRENQAGLDLLKRSYAQFQWRG